MFYELDILIALLLIKHFIADFVLQTNRMIAEKGTYGAKHGIYHSAIHAALSLSVVLWFVSNPVTAVTFAFMDGVIHYHVDWLKTNINKWREITIQDVEFWVWFGADQLAHQLTYVGLAFWLLAPTLEPIELVRT